MAVPAIIISCSGHCYELCYCCLCET